MSGRVDRDRRCREAASGNDLNQQASEGMADHRRLLLKLADRLDVVGRDLADALVREDLGMRLPLGHRLGIVGPPRLHGGVAGLLEDRGPAIPAAWK